MTTNKLLAILAILVGITILTIIIHIVLLYRQIPQYARYWAAQNKQKSADKSLIYVALGDSTAQAIGAKHPQKGYVGLVAAYLRQTTNRPVHIINISASGARLQDVLDSQLSQLANYKPDIITMEIGANDMKNYNKVQFEKQFNLILDRLPSTAVVSDLPWFGHGRHSNSSPNAIEASTFIRQELQARGFNIAPLQETTRVNDSLKVYAADLFHPSDTGYQNWAKAFITGMPEIN